jgi:hypothetical protein
MKPIRLLACLLFCLAGLLVQSHAAERASIRGILVAASNQEGPSDRRLAAYEPTLRRILRFESYRFLGEGSTALAVPAQGGVPIGQGHRLELQTESSSGDSVKVRVRWLDGERVLMQTGLSLRPGVPAVLGGPARGNGEVYAVIVVGR